MEQTYLILLISYAIPLGKGLSVVQLQQVVLVAVVGYLLLLGDLGIGKA
jgi:hypothetical protein